MLEGLTIVDLSHPINPNVPTWTGGCGFDAQIKMDYPQGLRVHKLHMHAGLSTHLDAPSHFFEKGLTLADLDLKNFIVPIYVVTVPLSKEGQFIEKEDVQEFIEEYGEPKAGSFIAFSTGWSEKFHDKDAYRANLKFPGVRKEAVECFLPYNIAGIGIDTLSPDGCDNRHPVHHLILGQGKYIIENLNQLDQLPVLGAYLIALPLKIDGGTECPIRAIAFFDEE